MDHTQSQKLTAQLEGAIWRKSPLSGGDSGGNCVEVAALNGGVGVRDSKNPSGPKLVFTSAEWSAFIGGVKAGEFG